MGFSSAVTDKWCNQLKQSSRNEALFNRLDMTPFTTLTRGLFWRQRHILKSPVSLIHVLKSFFGSHSNFWLRLMCEKAKKRESGVIQWCALHGNSKQMFPPLVCYSDCLTSPSWIWGESLVPSACNHSVVFFCFVYLLLCFVLLFGSDVFLQTAISVALTETLFDTVTSSSYWSRFTDKRTLQKIMHFSWHYQWVQLKLLHLVLRFALSYTYKCCLLGSIDSVVLYLGYWRHQSPDIILLVPLITLMAVSYTEE